MFLLYLLVAVSFKVNYHQLLDWNMFMSQSVISTRTGYTVINQRGVTGLQSLPSNVFCLPFYKHLIQPLAAERCIFSFYLPLFHVATNEYFSARILLPTAR